MINGNYNIFKRVDMELIHRLKSLSHVHDSFNPKVSGDGSTIVWNANPGFRLVKGNVGLEPSILSNINSPISFQQILSYDGSIIVWASTDSGARPDIYKIKNESSPIRLSNDRSSLYPQISKMGDTVIWVGQNIYKNSNCAINNTVVSQGNWVNINESGKVITWQTGFSLYKKLADEKVELIASNLSDRGPAHSLSHDGNTIVWVDTSGILFKKIETEIPEQIATSATFEYGTPQVSKNGDVTVWYQQDIDDQLSMYRHEAIISQPEIVPTLDEWSLIILTLCLALVLSVKITEIETQKNKFGRSSTKMS